MVIIFSSVRIVVYFECFFSVVFSWDRVWKGVSFSFGCLGEEEFYLELNF